MPKIQQYVAQGSPQGGGGALATPQAFGAMPAAVGDGFSRLGAFLEQKAERDAFFGIQRDMAKVRGDWTQRVLELEQNVEPGAPDFTKKVLAEYDAAMEQMRGERTLPRHLAERLAMEQDQVRTSLMTRSMAFEAQERGRKRRADAEDYRVQASRNSFFDPANATLELERLPEAIQALGLTGAAAEDIQRRISADIAQNALRGLIQRGHLDLAEQALKEGPLAPHVSGDVAATFANGIANERTRLANEAERKRREAAAEARTEVDLAFRDTLTSIELTGRDPGLLTPQTIRAAFPNNPGQASRLIAQLENAREYYNVRQSVALTTPAQDAEMRNRLAGRVGGVNAGQTAQQLQDFERALAAKYRAIDDDAVSYLLNNSPELRQTFAAGANDPAMFRRGLELADRLQADLGVPTWRRTYLGKNAAASMVASIQANTPERAANELENMAQRYGSKWANVLNELAGSGLDPAYAVIGRLDKPTDAVTRVNLTQAMQTPLEALKKGFPETENNDLRERIRSDMQSFRNTFAYVVGGNEIAAREMEAANRLALFYRSRGLSASDAAQRATKELITDRFDFEGTFRAPKGLGSTASRTAQATLEALQPSDLAAPPSSNPNLSVEYRQRAAWESARQGVWITTNMDKGLMLVHPNGTPVLRADGSQVRFDFNNMPAEPRFFPAPSMGGMVAP